MLGVELGVQRLYLIWGEVQEPAMAALQVRGRVVEWCHRQVHLAVDVVQYGLNDRLSAGQEQILRVGPARAWTHYHVTSVGNPHALDDDVVGLR